MLLPYISISQPSQPQISVDTAKTGAPISPYIYGQFLEHGGDIVNSGVWAELLVDRKFFYPISVDAPTPPPVMENAQGNPRARRLPTRWWSPVGGSDVVTMDRASPYTGEHSPQVFLNATIPHGIRQGGIAVRRGREYTGRLVIEGDVGSVVTAALIWGNGTADRQSIVIRSPASSYATVPLHFVAAADSDDAVLSITGTGVGSFHVGAISLMPADNIRGFRAEVIAAFKQLNFGVLRFPGGNFVSSYEWRDAVGDIDKRPPIFDMVWHAVQPNDVGTDEFLTLCELIGVAPYVTVNAGFGDAWSARELLEYTNGDATSAMGKWRSANGHPAPYDVKLWGIGNEPWGDYQMGTMSLPQFELKHHLFAKAMRQVDPSITLIAGGAMPDVMEGADQARRINGQYVPDYLSSADWSGQLLLHCLDDIDMLSEHYYASGTEHTDMRQQKKVPIDPPLTLTEWARAPAVQVRAKYEHYQEYLRRIPGLRAKPVPIAIDEWAYLGTDRNAFKVVPAYAWAFHEMFRHSDVFQLGAFTFATALITESRTDAVLNPTGLLFQLYAKHFGVIPVEVSGNSPQPRPRFPAGGDQPSVNPGSPTYPLDVVAALSKDGKRFTLAVLNPSDAAVTANIAVHGSNLADHGMRWRMAPSDIDAVNTPDAAPHVTIDPSRVGPLRGSVTVPAYSVNLYSYSIN